MRSPQNINKSLKYIQLIEINKFKSVRVIQCKVEIDRTIKKCGMFSHTMDVENGKYSYIQETSRNMQAYAYLGLFPDGTRLHNRIKIEFIGLSTSHVSRLGSDGSCSRSTPIPTDHGQILSY